MDTSTRQRGPQYGSRPSQPASFSGFPSKLRHEVNEDVRGRPSPRPLGSWRTTGPASGTLPAGSSVIAGRRIFDRNHHQPRLGASTARHASNSPANTPGKIFNRAGLTNNGATPKFTFSPRLPPNATRESFSAVTPGRSFRASTADLNGRAMSKTSSTNLFPMRIASPPPELDGEELAKQVPDSPDRVGSVYADEFLSHLVPAELDDLQRRQFLCVLDLRRLKYAASEIFAKKDWRVNIMNFAKEYEKSRSLIMLRYGLYEFKTVPASRELLKKWKEENNVPEEDEEMEEAEAPKSNGTANNFRSSVKRRAADDLDRDSASTVAASGPNKRRVTEREPLAESTPLTSNAGATPFAKKTKRGAEHLDEPDENQHSKKKSSTLSIFEDVANSSPARQAASPTKAPAKNLFAQPPKQAAPRQPAVGAVAKVSSGNIFGHLSEQNSPEGSDDEEDNEGDSEDAEGEDEEPAGQAPAPKAAASGAPSSFGTKTSEDVPTDGSSLTKGPGLFGRITQGGDGAPGIFSAKPPASPPKESQDKTWNPNTPIKFGGATSQTGTSLFGASTSQPSSIFASKPTEGTGSIFGSTTPKASAASTFGTQIQDFGKETPKQAAPSLFGQASKPSDPSSGLFGNGSKVPAFGASTPAQQKSDEKESSALAATPGASLFGQAIAASTTPFGKPADAPATQAQPTSIFANLNTPATTAQASAPSLFGTTTDKPSGSLFGAKSDEKPSSTPALFGAQPPSTSTLFGAKASSGEEKKEESAPKRKKPDSDEAGAVFGSTTGEPASKKYTFGGNAPTPASSLPPKTAEAAKGSTEAGAVFGTGSQDSGKTYSFGSTASTTPAASSSKPADTPAPVSLFGTPAPQAEPAKAQPSIFANAPAPGTGFTFGGASSTPSTNLFGAASGNDANNSTTNQQSNFSFGSTGTPAPAPAANSFTFNAGGDQGSFNNPFSGGAAAGVSFDFGATQSQSASAPFQFGSSAAPAAPVAQPSSSFTFGGDSQAATNGPSSSSFTFGGASQPANAAPAPSSNMFGGAQPNGGSSIFNFGGPSQAQSQPTSSANMFSGQPANAAQGIFAGSLAPPAGSSTGTNTPLFGGASSIATTPATGTPEPEAAQAKKDNATNEQTADEDGKPQEQISLTDGGPGEEDEQVVHEVRAKALRLAPKSADDDDDKDQAAKKNPWKTEGLGPLRLLKHKSTGTVRILLRGEPRGNVAMNKLVLPDFDYKVDKGAKWIKVPCAKDDGKGLETWMLQVKTNELALKLADALEENKKANKK
ncbi:hypothetical protein diail_1273 [Diaporthe ilicicola]|nr:hypothetical protein diail_1273 [Diaporthe ilicicola]